MMTYKNHREIINAPVPYIATGGPPNSPPPNGLANRRTINKTIHAVAHTEYVTTFVAKLPGSVKNFVP